MAPIHPGEILMEEFLKPFGISQYKLAKEIGVPARRINEIVHGADLVVFVGCHTGDQVTHTWRIPALSVPIVSMFSNDKRLDDLTAWDNAMAVVAIGEQEINQHAIVVFRIPYPQLAKHHHGALATHHPD